MRSSCAYDIIAIDIDETLVNDARDLPVRNLCAIERARDAGALIVIATARAPRGARPVAHALGLDAPAQTGETRPMIAFNGALTWCFTKHGPIEHFPLPKEIAHSLIAAARSVEPTAAVSFEAADKWYTDRDVTQGAGEPGLTGPDYVGPLSSFLHIRPTKIVFHAPFDRLKPVWETIRNDFVRKGLAQASFSDYTALQVVGPKVTKGASLERLAKRLSVAQERIMAIGDAPNDSDMLEYAGTGVAVANAWDEVKALADEVTSATNNEAAVAEAIERFAFTK